MLGLILRVVGSVVLLLWGLIHLVPIRSILHGFGRIPTESRRIVVMTWVNEGLSLCFVGALVGLISYFGCGRSDGIMIFAASGFLLATALISLFTGARNPSVWLKLCPVVKILVAGLFIITAAGVV